MKFLKYIFFAIGFLSISACSNEFDLVEDKKDIPVVYAMLDYLAAEQFVRVERAFISPTTSAIELAKNPDSFYYKNATVKLIRTSKGSTKTFTLKEIDGNSVGYPRKDGLFAKSPNKLYSIKSTEMPLEPGDIVELEISIGEGDVVKSKTSIISQVASSVPREGNPFTVSKTGRTQLKWNANENNGGVLHSLELNFNYSEVINGVETKKTINWPIANNKTGEFHFLEQGEFLTFLAANINKDPGAKRFFSGFDYYVHSGDANYAGFLTVSQANTGITGSGEVPVYSNLSRGIGIFGSKATASIFGIDLSSVTLDEIKVNDLTKGLNFQ